MYFITSHNCIYIHKVDLHTLSCEWCFSFVFILFLFRQNVISQIPGLEILDDTEVLEKERAQARKTYRLQQSSHGSRKRKEDSSRKHTHMHKKSNTIIRQ